MKPTIRYALCLLTHGDAPELETTVSSFASYLSPSPAELLCVVDGPGRLPPVEPLGPWMIEQSSDQEGFCSATRRLWSLAARTSSDYVLWLENDFLLLQPLDLTAPAEVLDGDLHLTQIQFIRDPVNREERKAGGLFEFWQGHERWERRFWGFIQDDYVVTTNPALMRTGFVRQHLWPPLAEAPSECEGRFGIALRERGYAAGVWGDGSPLVRHVGRRRGIGY